MSGQRVAYRAQRILTGTEQLTDHAVVVRDGVIHAVVPHTQIGTDCPLVDCGASVLAPGLVDLQVNGGGGVLFTQAPTRAALRTIVAAHRAHGTTTLLPTVITGQIDQMRAAIAVVEQAMNDGEPGIGGIHLEGPFLNPARAGVHDATLMRRMRLGDVELFPRARPGFAVLVTVAPEMLDPGCIEALRARGITVAAGHTAATAQQAQAAFAAGVAGVTHLFNATGGVTAREPGVVGAALASDDTWVSLIADGHHVADTTLRVAMRAKRAGRCLLVSDAMPPAGGGGPDFALGPHQVQVTDGRCQTQDGTLAGAAVPLADGVRRCVTQLGIPLAEAVRMASTYPARAAGVAAMCGQIAPGRRADIVTIDRDLRMRPLAL